MVYHIQECNGSRYDHCMGMILSFVILVVLERLFYLVNVFIHHRMFITMNAVLNNTTLCKALALDQSYHDSHSKSNIYASCEVLKINQALTMNFPYVLSLFLDTLLTAYYMIRENLIIGSSVVILTAVLKLAYLYPIHLFEQNIYRLQRKMESLANEIRDEAMDIVSTIKMFSTQTYHVEEHREATKNSLVHSDRFVAIRCQREFVGEALRYLLLAVILYLTLADGKRFDIGPGSFMTFYLLWRSISLTLFVLITTSVTLERTYRQSKGM